MSDPEGFIVIHRKIMNWEWYSDINTAHLFMHCILKANHKDKVWRGVEIKRGSFITSLETLSTETGLSVMQVRTALKKLQLTGEITSCSTSKYRIITVKNYIQYQSRNKQNNRQNNRKISGKITGKQQSNNNQVTTTNNDNNGTMKTSEGVRPTGALPSHRTTASLDIAPEGESAAPQETQKEERLLPLFTHEWKAYCERYHSDKTEDEIWERWEELDNGRRLSRKAIEEIREKISDG